MNNPADRMTNPDPIKALMEQMRAALEPFAKCAPGSGDAQFLTWLKTDKDVDLTFGDFRRAASALAAFHAATAPGHTDLMVTPESIDAFMEANPLPPDPQPNPVDAVPRGEEIERLRAVIESAAAWFDDYARQHHAKNPPDTVKAATNEARAATLRAALSTRPPRGGEEGEMRPMSIAPKDQTFILALFKPDLQGRLLAGLSGRFMVLRHQGVSADGFDFGWSARGLGGIVDDELQGWWPLPAAPDNATQPKGGE